MQEKYDPHKLEAAAQRYWEDRQSFKATEDPKREKFYCLSMFPYPSGKLHMGHVRNYTIGDVISRYQRMLGKNVLQPMGWDAFGLPAENAAIENATAPAKWTYANIKYMKRQLKALGFGYDWDRELATCDADYYRWEQWLFTRLVEKGLAYRKKAAVNWDPVDQTVLANEQVIDGRGWRSGAVVEKREIAQWFLKITDYAEQLLAGLEQLGDWPEQVIAMQRNWIGRSEGVMVDFDIEHDAQGQTLSVFTTRPDTLMGVTYMAVAAEHPLALQVAQTDATVAAFIAECKQGGVAEADLETMEKKGIALNINALHPISGEPIPVYAANFVLMSYGTGAVMAVPAHDQRDWEFSERYGIPRKQVIAAAEGAACDIERAAWTEKGVLINSAQFDGMDFAAAFAAIADYLSAHGKGQRQVNFRLRDWGVSRQRYWGCPIPMIKTPNGIQAATELPVRLPQDVIADGSGSPLKQLAEFYDLGNGCERETDTFDTFFESSWYYARYCCPDADAAMLDERAKYWLPVDQYVGGIEHAILHLLYARFFNKLMRDEGLVDNDEPFSRLLTQGMVVAETWYRQNEGGAKEWFNPADVETERDAKGKIIGAKLKADGRPVTFGGVEKMSKSKNNGVDPQTLIDRYGADTVRLYTMFTSPPQQSLEWSDEGVEGASRFIKRLWFYCHDNRSEIQSVNRGQLPPPTAEAADDGSAYRRDLHSILRKALFDYQRHQFNTVVSACMTVLNKLAELTTTKQTAAPLIAEGIGIVLRLLAPIAPHITHYLWRELKFGEDILAARMPQVDESALVQDTVAMVVQVSGKLRGKITVATDADRATIEAAALANANVQRFIDGRAVRKVIVVPGKLVNIVV